MKLLLLFSLLIISLTGNTTENSCTSDNTLKQRAVLIEKYSKGKGSGILYNKNIIITNNHVIEDIEYIWVYIPVINRSISAQILYSSSTPDIAILKLDEPLAKITPLTIALAPKSGDKLRLIGFPFGKKHRLSVAYAKFDKFIQITDKTGTYLSSIIDNEWAYAGDSGGGMFNCKGELTGLHFANLAPIGKPNHIIAVTPVDIKKAITTIIN